MSTFVFSADAIRAIDEDLERLDLLELTMETAGARVACHVHERFASERRAHPSGLILAGSGANGGDAFVAARHLLAFGWHVEVLALDTRHPLALRMSTRLESFASVQALTPESLRGALPSANVVLDGLLGTGFTPPLRAPLDDIVRTLNASGRTIVSIDVPSGLRSDTVEHDLYVKADLTLALVGPKPALLFHDLGEVDVLELGVPNELLERHAVARNIDMNAVRSLLPVRSKGAHKGTAGRVWILGGSPGYVGAPALSALGALRAGSGLVTLYARTSIEQHALEAMPHRLERWEDLPNDSRPDALAVGMGLREDGPVVARMVLAWRVKTVLDADALQPELAGLGHDEVVWTPHPGEAARLLSGNVEDVARDPFGSVRALRKRFGGTVVLKGAPTLVATREGVYACPFGNPGMATGGMGDVLSGVIASLLGQGLSGADAAVLGVALHALAGDAAAKRYGYGLVASDVAEEVAATWHNLTRAF
ncbi:NAD(P)H-hydrate epimerase [Deinococcus yavapaiensis KR-236]|uniref:Bifunctional NAD(P)H-hydrate repair enzyme n=2 Tax=Deinococcus TaxID=1298 RepID=A0A318S413_9DEIO|nr:NAD(P)H-hydrate dehydratase [Deinococcus yavapaiensis]PYE51187.1 NAD(P)H-hydrate epimerase [Deinococcus yavapaiensis KR-236]